MMMYPFFYRPQSLKLEEGWHLFPLEQYFQQIASQVSLEGKPGWAGKQLPPPMPGCLPGLMLPAGEAPEAAPPTPRLPQSSQWRLSEVNRDFTTCPTYPPAVIVPAAVDDDTLRKAARFRQGGRFPVLSYYHPKNGTVSPSPHPAPRPLSRHRHPLGKGGSKPPILWGSPGAPGSRCPPSLTPQVMLRSSQPLTGPNRKRCREDEILLGTVLDEGERGFIIDTRSAQAAKQARMTGGGTEPKSSYPRWRRLHRPLER